MGYTSTLGQLLGVHGRGFLRHPYRFEEPVMQEAPAGVPAIELDSLFDMVVNGGPLMIPIALCSVVALAFTVERSIRLRDGETNLLAGRIRQVVKGAQKGVTRGL